MDITNKIFKEAIDINVVSAIDEDIKNLDKTSVLISSKFNALAEIKAKEKGVLCGIPWVEKTYKKIDPKLKFTWLVEEGGIFKKNQKICKIHGNFNSLLTGERIALNFLQTLSGTATITRTFVNKIKTTSTILLDTRKTLPGLRIAQKYAVKIGGGMNQRLGLYDEILVKENHIKSIGSFEKTLQKINSNQKISNYQIEVENIKQLQLAINLGAKNILLDNFSISSTKKAVEINQDFATLEVSGNININNILDYAKTGVSRISVGAITKNIEAIDFSMIIDTI
jgi:nicotinate-nucleotide pyrophosphorylase (carboxylating)|tara:strand:- start:716 stop:1564 length:849 start_codon:yes stop_codon:yes gene_type:complete